MILFCSVLFTLCEKEAERRRSGSSFILRANLVVVFLAKRDAAI